MKTAAAFLAARYPFVNELLTKRLALVITACAGLVLATNAVVLAVTITTAEGYVTRYGPVIGGDFIVFNAAANAAAAGEAAAVYDPAALAARLKEAFPARETFRLSWQYPPTMFLVVWPLAFAPYLTSFALWVLATGGFFYCAVRKIWPNRRALFLVLASPAVFQTIITGQTGFLTAALLASIAYWADRRWLLAGLAAGLLTVKPQLGLLVPIAFAAAGCWRAFGAATATAMGLAGASLALFGAAPWAGFLEALTTHGERLHSSIFPFYKLVSAYGGAVMLGAPASIAMALQLLVMLGLTMFVALVWRRVADWDLRLAALSAAAPLVSPYAFYYEIAIFAPAVLVIARRGVETGWLRGERPALAALWLAPMFLPGSDGIPGLPLAFSIAALAFALVARRALAARQARPAPALA